MFWTLLTLVACIFLMMAPGFVAIRRAWMAPEGVTTLSRLMLNAIYPCLIFASITENFDLPGLLHAWTLPAACMAIMVTGYVVGRVLTLFKRLPSEQHRRAFLFQTTINNYSFFPMGLVAQLYGADGVAALIFSTLGAEITMWSLGVMTLAGIRPGREMIKPLLSTSMLSLYAALGCVALFYFAGIDRSVLTARGTWIASLHTTLKTMGACTVPVAMMIGGARIALMHPDTLRDGYVWLTSLLRLVAIPLLAVLVLHLLPLSPAHREIMTIVAVMPASMASLMFSEIFGGDKPLMSGSVLLTHLLALLTVPVLLSLLL